MPSTVRFDDRIMTALNHVPHGESGAATQWRQLIDLLAQASGTEDRGLLARALVRVHELGAQIGADARLLGVRALTGRLRHPTLVRYFAHDEAPVAASAIAGARLRDAEWEALVPELPPRARALLRNRDDLGPRTRASLVTFAAADNIITDARPVAARAQATPPPMDSDRPAPVAIADLVARIERFRKTREESGAESQSAHGAPVAPGAVPTRFGFATDVDGRITDVTGAPRAALIGFTIADVAHDDGPGPDAAAAAAFRQRMPIQSARMHMAGAPAIAGTWRIEAEPAFDNANGRFLGYRGILRRPEPGEDAAALTSTGQRADRLRQVIHELRTPLGAIIGFAEIIEQQLFGPASADYRALAATIVADAERLLAGIDDLDAVARHDATAAADADDHAAPAWLARQLAARMDAVAEARGAQVNIQVVEPSRDFALSPDLVERIAVRMIAALLHAAAADDVLEAQIRTLVGTHPVNRLTVSLPAAWRSLDEMTLFQGEVGEGAEHTGGPPTHLGLGFSLRLVRNMARGAGGELQLVSGALRLTLPARADTQRHRKG